mgnify:CR=1 FL=1
MLTIRLAGRVKKQARIASLGAMTLVSLLPGCVNGLDYDHAQSVAVTVPKVYTDGLSGRPPVPVAETGQTLSMEPARRIVFETQEGTSLALDVAPDGTSIVFDMLGDIYQLPIGGGTAQPITSGMAMDTQPVFSPDGSRILFLSDRSGAENLWQMDADGTHLTQISYYDDDPIFVSPEWAPDGKSILVSRFWPDRNAYELWRFNAVPGDMGEVARASHSDDATTTSSIAPSFASDGMSIYLASLSETPPVV